MLFRSAPPPPYRTLQRWLVPPSIPPHVLLFSGDVSPNTHPSPNQSTLILPSACDWTGASSTAPVRSVRGLTVVLRLAALVLSPCAVRRPLALSTSSTTERNKEMTVHCEDDSRDPAARVVILFFRDGEGYQLGCAGPMARLAQAFISYV